MRPCAALQNTNKILFVDVDNVTSQQLNTMRKEMRDLDAKMVMGKNTLMRKSLLDLQNTSDVEHISIIRDQLIQNTGMIFTNGDLIKIKDILDANARGAPARIGQIAPIDVIIPAGPTKCDPKQTQFFQALQIPTKINRGQIDIINSFTIIEKGQIINQSQCALLDKLKIAPFEYKMNIKSFLDGGQLYDAKVLSINVIEKFKAKCQNMVALSLGSGYITEAAAPHLIAKGFKNLAAVSLASGFDIPQFEVMKAALNAPAEVKKSVTVDAPIDDKPTDDDGSDLDGDFDIFNPFGDEDDEY